MFLTRLALSRPISTAMACLIVVLLGITSLRNLNVDLLPNVTYPSVSVIAIYEGAGPYEVETRVTQLLEQAFSSVTGVDEIFSSSTEGSSTVLIRLQWGVAVDTAIHDLRQAVEKIHSLLPEDLEGPYIYRHNVNDSPIMFVGLTSEMDPRDLTLLAEKQIAPQMERLPGVARVHIRGRVRREIQVDLIRPALEARQVSVRDVVSALQRENTNQPAGDLTESHLKWLVRSRGEFQNLDQIRETVVRQEGERIVRIKDIGQVVDGIEEQTELTRTNGVPGLMLYIIKESGANTINVSEQIHRTVKNLNRRRTDVTLTIRIDKSDFIRQAMYNVAWSAVYGMLLAVVVMILFLQSFRSALVIAISIPLSALATFVMIYFQGFSLNMISFGGLALGIGLLVDNSIVVLESIFRKRDEGLDATNAAITGTSEVAGAITASTVTTLIVFLPLLFVQGITGILLHQLAWVVTMSLTCSLLVSLTLTPVLTTVWTNPARAGISTSLLHRAIRPLRNVMRQGWSLCEALYGWSLGMVLTRMGLGIGFLLILMLSAIIVGWTPIIGTEFLPSTDESQLGISAQMTPGIELATLDRHSQLIEKALLNLDEQLVTAVFVGDDARDGDEWHTSRFRVKLVPRQERERTLTEIRAGVSDMVGEIPGMTYRVQASRDMIMGRLLRGIGGGNLVIDVQGTDMDTIQRVASRVVEQMNRTPGLVNVHREHTAKRPVLAATIDRAKAGLLGISVLDISQTIETAVRGTRATLFREKGEEIDVRVRLQAKDRDRASSVEQVCVRSGVNKLVPLKNIVDFNRDAGDVEINRRDQQRTIVIYADVEDRDLGHTVEDLEKQLNALDMPADVTYRIAGDWEHQQQSFADLRMGFILALLLMYAVMASQFESLRDPFLVLFTVPLAGVGVILALIATNTTLNVQSFIGVIILAGIVVNNSIVLIDYLNRLRQAEPNWSWNQLLTMAAVRRFRPISMTTLTTVCAMLPLAVGWGEGGELQSPMARVVIGGLIAGTLVTLFVIPMVCRFFAKEHRGVDHP
ncbi:MAG: efflux RND transporter permease subunit [Pirellulaceae bacterium]|nr:efflux RND transporter permease subunit [Pirellulaceae bacterium]